MDTGLQFTELKTILKRRRKSFWAIFMIIFLAGVIIAIALPPVYKSEAIIKVEEQEIPEDFVQSTISEYMEERIAKINQEILHRENLLKIAEAFNLNSITMRTLTKFIIASTARLIFKVTGYHGFNGFWCDVGL